MASDREIVTAVEAIRRTIGASAREIAALERGEMIAFARECCASTYNLTLWEDATLAEIEADATMAEIEADRKRRERP
jgi:hypothetical protein